MKLFLSTGHGYEIRVMTVKSAASDVAKRHLREYIKLQKSFVVILMETRTQFSSVKRFWN